jgi:hypothetical protein
MGDVPRGSSDRNRRDDFRDLREEFKSVREDVARAKQLVIWGFGISWLVIGTMYAAGFTVYLSAKLDPIANDITEVRKTLEDIKPRLTRAEDDISWIRQNLTDGKAGTAATTKNRTPRHLIEEAPPAEVCESLTNQMDFGEVKVGAKEVYTATVQNSSAQVITLSGFGIQGPAGSDFKLDTNSCRQPIAGGHSCTLRFTFSPGAGGNRDASLGTICNGTKVSTTLKGEGVPSS